MFFSYISCRFFLLFRSIDKKDEIRKFRVGKYVALYFFKTNLANLYLCTWTTIYVMERLIAMSPIVCYLSATSFAAKCGETLL